MSNIFAVIVPPEQGPPQDSTDAYRRERRNNITPTSAYLYTSPFTLPWGAPAAATSSLTSVDWYRLAVMEQHVLREVRSLDDRVIGIGRNLRDDNSFEWFFKDRIGNGVLLRNRRKVEQIITRLYKMQLHYIVIDTRQSLWADDDYLFPAWTNRALDLLPLPQNYAWLIDDGALTCDLSQVEDYSAQAATLSKLLLQLLVRYWRQGALTQQTLWQGYQHGPITNVVDYIISDKRCSPVQTMLQQYEEISNEACDNCAPCTTSVRPASTFTRNNSKSRLRPASIALARQTIQTEDLRYRSLPCLIKDWLQLSGDLIATSWELPNPDLILYTFSIKVDTVGQTEVTPSSPLWLDDAQWTLLQQIDWRYVDDHCYLGCGTYAYIATVDNGGITQYPEGYFWLQSPDPGKYQAIVDDISTLKQKMVYLGKETQAASRARPLIAADNTGHSQFIPPGWFYRDGRNMLWLENNRKRVADGEWPLYAWSDREDPATWQIAAVIWSYLELWHTSLPDYLQCQVVMLPSRILVVPAPDDLSEKRLWRRWFAMLEDAQEWIATPVDARQPLTATQASVWVSGQWYTVERSPVTPTNNKKLQTRAEVLAPNAGPPTLLYLTPQQVTPQIPS